MWYPLNIILIARERMKFLIGALILIGLIGGGYWLLQQNTTTPALSENAAPAHAATVAPGTYVVRADASSVTWAGKKPLIDGYVNTGSIAVADGTITVAEDNAQGSFTIDMNTLSVSATPTKPGQENALENHLKSERWFDVATHPTATFTIDAVNARADSETTHVYDIAGSLTLKGETHDVSFPATIYRTGDTLHAQGSLEIDRTLWGITFGSANFFENMANNAIDDMVAISFTLVADATQE